MLGTNTDPMADESTATQGSADPKIIDLINARSPLGWDDEAFVSLEFFPPRTKEGVKVRAPVGATPERRVGMLGGTMYPRAVQTYIFPLLSPLPGLSHQPRPRRCARRLRTFTAEWSV